MNYEELKALFEQSLEKNLKVQSLLKKIVSGTANFSDTTEYSNAVSSILSYIVKRNVSDIEDAEEITEKLLHDYYEHINSILAQVQSSLDKNNGLHIKPQEAVFPKERVKKFSHSLIDPTVPFETIQRRAGSGIETICRSFHDDYIKENAEIRHNAGLKCYIVRTSSGKCCDWCSRIAGRYVYGREPKDVYRRHDNCDCKCIFENGRERQDVWSKKKWEVRETPKTDFIPKSLTPRQAEQIQAENMKYKGLDISQESDIIKSGVPYLDAKMRLVEHEIRDCYNTSNPKYSTGREYQINCQRCVSAYEARRRGFNVTAKPCFGDSSDTLPKMLDPKGWAAVYKDGLNNIEIPDGITGAAVKRSICNKMASYGSGARAIVRVRWKNGGGHVFIAEQMGKATQFIDPQSSKSDVAYYFGKGMIKPSQTRILRIDDKDFTDLIESCVE